MNTQKSISEVLYDMDPLGTHCPHYPEMISEYDVIAADVEKLLNTGVVSYVEAVEVVLVASDDDFSKLTEEQSAIINEKFQAIFKRDL